MSNAKNPAAPAFPPEPPELAAERDRLLPELEKQAKAATGTLQSVLRKLHELMAHTRPGAPFDIQIYGDVKAAFERFMKDPVLPPPPVIMQCVEFMQKRLVAFGFTGQMQLPPGAPPVPPGLVETQVSAPAAAPAPIAPPPAAGGIKDGFEGSAKRSLQINPEAVVPRPAGEEKSEQQKLESFKTWMKNPNVGNVKG
ncbi:hypothetical protein [Stigmatella aurantiaca]|uniref:Conserved uncharacterized protein n=1 Tax=Stigmatella aurantiaca (strain DW4/3-1) TaxID=378806 RepID=Q08UN6_STIAD|nr:hypothetical protein [Stigmatella aurantiaca]ADO70845.1 conserved uncharacterized protein [Stigmatella aurantiaca DW4/3-1]EAU64208.1 hypothetical protein STIAU_4373 [Stigmatella aurantiaca DW4/3-1]